MTKEKREHWGSKASFLLACIGYAVGLGNMWRFPYLCYKSGGGAFLVPYLVMLVLCGLPLLFMELIAGQYARRGPIGALGRMCPLLKGAGVATVMISFWLCTYYNVIIAWALYYLWTAVKSATGTLPWANCDNEWNTPNCWAVGENTDKQRDEFSVSSTQEFYDHDVLGVTSGIEDMGHLRPELLGLLFLAWVIVYFCLWKSVRATGKVVYFTATVPYLLLFVFLWRAVTLPGAMEGIIYFLTPQWDKMWDAKVWVYAAAQVFNSIGIAFGSLVAFASYNPFHNRRLLHDAVIVTVVDAITCIICGLAVFATLGNLALEKAALTTEVSPTSPSVFIDRNNFTTNGVGDKSLDTSNLSVAVEDPPPFTELGSSAAIDAVVTDGPGLVFVVFPHALARLPLPQLWAAIFFAMLVLLGIDSQVIVTSVRDALEDITVHRFLLARHEVLVLIICAVAFACGIPNVFQGGVYFFQLVDYYAAALSLMYIAFFECVAILWIYGANRLAENAKDMTGKKTNLYIRVCWYVISPVIIFSIWMFNLVDYQEPTYNKDSYHFPSWAIAMGWCVAATSLAAIPICAVWAVYRARGPNLGQKILSSLRSPLARCPCGCESALDENFSAAHGGIRASNLSLVTSGCDEKCKEKELEER